MFDMPLVEIGWVRARFGETNCRIRKGELAETRAIGWRHGDASMHRGNNEDGVMQTRMNQFYYGAIFLLALLIFPSLAMAEQAESSIACDEGVISEPILLNYGNHTTGCEIGTTVDLDLFQFGATAGDQIRIIVDGRTGDFDPRIELRAPDGSVVQDTFCNPGGNTCTVTVPETLT